MAAAYDSYDYPAYWVGRDYEHKSEVIALKTLLLKVPKVKVSLEIGGGYGRLVPTYIFRSKRVILSDPSARLLKVASNHFNKYKKISYLHSKIQNLNHKVRSSSIDLVIMVRVLHHLENINEAFQIISKLLSPGGYFILEFANKSHLKATFKEFRKGNITFPIDIFPKDIRSKKSIKANTLPFINWHPDVVKHTLTESGFEVIETLSVSNFRSNFLKNILPLETIVSLEKKLQGPLSHINFGPSMFVLARKKN